MQYLLEYADYMKQLAEKKLVTENDPDLEYSEDDTFYDYQRKLAKRMKLREKEMEDEETVQRLHNFGPMTNSHMPFINKNDNGGEN